MKYTNRQIKKILNVEEFIGMSNTLSKVYLDFDNKSFFIDTFVDRDRIYKIYCASIYNSIKAIQDSKEYFVNTKKYLEFEKMISKEFIASNNKYYKKENYKSTLFKIIETIRHQVNHSLKDDEDNNILFTAYLDFEILEKLRIVINDIFNEVYNQIDKDKVKEAVLNKPKIKYSMDKLTDEVNKLKLKIPENKDIFNSNKIKENEKILEIYEQLFNPDNIYDLLTKDPTAIENLEAMDKRIQKCFKINEIYIDEYGTKSEKESLKILKRFLDGNIGISINDLKKNVEKLKTDLEKLNETENKD